MAGEVIRASIVIRAHNAAATIERALESGRAQHFPSEEFEIIVVDDGSTDRTPDIVRLYVEGSKLRIARQANRGAIAAANSGFALSRGTYVTLLDADDELLPAFLRTVIARLEAEPHLDFVYSDYFEDVAGCRRVVRVRNVFETVAVGIMYRRASFSAIGFYRSDVFFAEYDVLLRTADIWRGAHIELPLFVYHRRPDSLTGSLRAVEEGKRQLRNLHLGREAEIELIRSYEVKE
jgi:glycosyltransferase involved in cell wall biosynthesis